LLMLLINNKPTNQLVVQYWPSTKLPFYKIYHLCYQPTTKLPLLLTKLLSITNCKSSVHQEQQIYWCSDNRIINLVLREISWGLPMAEDEAILVRRNHYSGKLSLLLYS
jgi:hypothetical protein